MLASTNTTTVLEARLLATSYLLECFKYCKSNKFHLYSKKKEKSLMRIQSIPIKWFTQVKLNKFYSKKLQRNIGYGDYMN